MLNESMPHVLTTNFCIDLEAYDIDPETGFVAIDDAELPEYYQPWTMLVTSLPKLLRSKQVGSKIDTLQVLGTHLLTTEAQWRRAHVTLGYLTQAFIWETKTKPRETVPACLGEPFTAVSRHFGMMPVLTYAGVCLWNCARRVGDTEKVDTDCKSKTLLRGSDMSLNAFAELQSIASFTGTRDEDAFNLVPVMIEAEGAKLIPLLLEALSADISNDQYSLESILETCTTTFKEMTKLLTIIHQNCSPDIFFHELRPFLAGSTGNDSLPDGVSFLQTDGPAENVKCVGVSVAQGAFFQYLDHMLGIVHSSTMALEMRAYMPQKHREFLKITGGYPSMKEVVERHPENIVLRKILQECIGSLQEWRTKHIAIVARYIVQPGRGSIACPGTEEKGTAGSLPVPFLKQYRDETGLHPQVANT